MYVYVHTNNVNTTTTTKHTLIKSPLLSFFKSSISLGTWASTSSLSLSISLYLYIYITITNDIKQALITTFLRVVFIFVTDHNHFFNPN